VCSPLVQFAHSRSLSVVVVFVIFSFFVANFFVRFVLFVANFFVRFVLFVANFFVRFVANFFVSFAVSNAVAASPRLTHYLTSMHSTSSFVR